MSLLRYFDVTTAFVLLHLVDENHHGTESVTRRFSAAVQTEEVG